MHRSMRVAALATAACAGTCLAQVHQGDIELRVEGARITTHAPTGPDRVFASVMGTIDPGYARDPGFDCATGTFPLNSRIGFRVLDALRVWDGQDFDEVSLPLMEVAFSTLSATTPASPGVVEGFTLSVGSNGTWHRHLEYTLLAPATPGTYLLTLELFSTAGTIEDSEPFWLVFSHEAPTGDLAAGVQWVRDTFMNPPPPCDPDVNQDGNVDQDDVACLAQVVGGDPTCSNADPDFNRDGNVDQDDISTLAQVVAGAACP
ncbi:MAG: hypothetical protein SFY69_12270 [Planctomycetota bacterium]|nr:hypothetical protein [Planctomycetota bacterium]